MRDYMEFIADKRTHAPHSGFDPGDSISDVLFPHQRDIVRWAVIGGRRAIFAAFGLGKSFRTLPFASRTTGFKVSSKPTVN